MYNQHEKQAGQHSEECGVNIISLTRLVEVEQPSSDYHHRLRSALLSVGAELLNARQKFPEFNSAHEGYGVLKEEVDEMWDAIKGNDIKSAREEAIQVAAMAVSFILDLERRV